jgi:hypothetical protein
MAEIMTPDNPRWEEFAEKLEGPEGCDFKEKEAGNPDSITWRCDNTRDKPLARAILEKMGSIDIEATFKFFDENGGHCDCEILFNVDPGSED